MSLCYGMKDGKLQTYVMGDDEDEFFEEDEDDLFEEDYEEEGIELSRKHGVNCSMDTCVMCADTIQLILFGKLPNDEEAPRQVCTGQVCDKCKNELKENKQRVVLEYTEENQFTGRYMIIPDERINSDYLDQIKDTLVLRSLTDDFSKL